MRPTIWKSFDDSELAHRYTVSTLVWKRLEAARNPGEDDSAFLFRLLTQPITTAEASPAEPEDQFAAKLARVIRSEEFRRTSKAVSRYLAVLVVLAESHPVKFSRVLRRHSRPGTRVYFSRVRATVVSSGMSTQAKKIGASGWWALTNLHVPQMRSVLVRILTDLDYPAVWVRQLFGSGRRVLGKQKHDLTGHGVDLGEFGVGLQARNSSTR